jgi:hypothetical protein
VIEDVPDARAQENRGQKYAHDVLDLAPAFPAGKFGINKFAEQIVNHNGSYWFCAKKHKPKKGNEHLSNPAFSLLATIQSSCAG